MSKFRDRLMMISGTLPPVEFLDWVGASQTVQFTIPKSGIKLSFDGYAKCSSVDTSTKRKLITLSTDNVMYLQNSRFRSWSQTRQSSIAVTGVSNNVKYRFRSEYVPSSSNGLCIAMNDSWGNGSQTPINTTSIILTVDSTVKWYDYILIYEYAHPENVLYDFRPAKRGSEYGFYDMISGGFLTNANLTGGNDE